MEPPFVLIEETRPDRKTGLVDSIVVLVGYSHGQARMHIELQQPLDGRAPVSEAVRQELMALRDALAQGSIFPSSSPPQT
jgi:hypothetical protein